MSEAGMSGLQKACVYQAKADTFSTVTAQQIKAISTSGASGIDKNQFMSFNGVAAAGFTAEATKVFDPQGCPGISANVMGNMSVEGMSGLQKACVYQAQDDTFSTISAKQIAAISTSGASGIDKNQFQQLNGIAAAGFTAEATKVFAAEACQGIDANVMGNVSAEGMSGFTSSCVYMTRDTAFSTVTPATLDRLTVCGSLTADHVMYMIPKTLGEVKADCFIYLAVSKISTAQIDALTPERCGLFLQNQTSTLNATTSRQFTLAQIGGFSPAGVMGLTGDFYGNQTSIKGIAFVDLFDVQKAVLYDYRPAADFKRKLYTGEIKPIVHWKDVDSARSTTSWLKMALVDVSELPATLDADFIRAIKDVTVAGLRMEMMSKLAVEAVAAITPGQAKYLTYECFASFSDAQIATVQPQAVAQMKWYNFDFLTVSQIASITADQVAALNKAVFCNKTIVKLLSDAQKSKLGPGGPICVPDGVNPYPTFGPVNPTARPTGKPTVGPTGKPTIGPTDKPTIKSTTTTKSTQASGSVANGIPLVVLSAVLLAMI